jgi:hypothetical protein
METTHESHDQKKASRNDFIVFVVMSEGKVCGSFFFTESTAAGIVCLDMVRGWLILQLKEDISSLIYRQGGAPPYFYNKKKYLDELLDN